MIFIQNLWIFFLKINLIKLFVLKPIFVLLCLLLVRIRIRQTPSCLIWLSFCLCMSMYLSAFRVCLSVSFCLCLAVILYVCQSVCLSDFHLCTFYLTSIVLEAKLFCLVSLSNPESELGESIIFITTYLNLFCIIIQSFYIF